MADRAALNAAKLDALVRARWGAGDRTRQVFPPGAALTDGTTGWVLLDSDPRRALGGALAWGQRAGIGELHLVADDEAGVVARRAAAFAADITVWEVHDRALRPAAPDGAPPRLPAPDAPALAAMLVDADLEVVVEGGMLRGEINGLEVARVATADAGTVLEVGVGRADRELTAMLHGDLAPTDSLTRVAAIVREIRRAGAEPHPLAQLVPERWLRARLVADPARVGLSRLGLAEPAVPRANLREPGIAVATGERPDGTRVVVACSVGIDLDAIPAAADARLAIDPDAELLIALPERDDHPMTRSLAALLRQPATVVTVSNDWRGTGS